MAAGEKILLLYLVAVVLYLPVGLYAGHYQGSPLSALRLLLFGAPFTISGIFLPAPQGCFWCICWGGCCGQRAAGGHGLLYLIGLFGDSYYGLTAALPPLAAAYEAGFQVFSYTRNGLFMAPLFLLLGARLGSRPPPEGPLSTGWGFCSPWF